MTSTFRSRYYSCPTLPLIDLSEIVAITPDTFESTLAKVTFKDAKTVIIDSEDTSDLANAVLAYEEFVTGQWRDAQPVNEEAFLRPIVDAPMKPLTMTGLPHSEFSLRLHGHRGPVE